MVKINEIPEVEECNLEKAKGKLIEKTGRFPII